jgi:hypothetical protein
MGCEVEDMIVAAGLCDYNTRNNIVLYASTLHCIALFYPALPFSTSPCSALHCTAYLLTSRTANK